MEKIQFGFRKGKDSRDDIGVMRIISEMMLDVIKDKFPCFIDWQKAFDRVDWTKLLEILRNIGVNWREHRLIRNLYMGQRLKLRLNQGETNSVKIGRGVRQGCCMSPLLFNLYGEYLMKETSSEVGCLKIGESNNNKVRITDDAATITKSQEELQDMVN
jgi:Reverse transcriptase (RNA-dependent DNA polymerase).